MRSSGSWLSNTLPVLMNKPIIRLVLCVVAVLAIVAALSMIPVSERPLIAVLAFLFALLIVSAQWGLRYAIFFSLLAALGFTLLVPPVGSLKISDWRDIFALIAFLVIGITSSHLSDRARKEAVKANQLHTEALAVQQQFADLVNSIEGIVWEADAQTFAFTFVSEQAERVLGYPMERWLKEPTFWKDHLHPEDRDRAVQFCQDATLQRTARDFEYRMIAADGRVAWMRDLIAVVAENGRVTRLRGVMVDITRRKRDEAALREQANLLNLTHDTIFVRDRDDVITYWNRGAEEFYGWTGQEAIGKVTHELMQTVFPVPLEKIQAELLHEGRWEGELVHTRKDGSHAVVASRWSLQRDDNGTPIAVLETNNDITERKRAEQAREEIEEQWRASFESNPTMYFVVDSVGTIVDVNIFGAEQLGYKREELIGQPVLNSFYEPDRQAVQNHANSCFDQAGRTTRWEARKIRKDGTMIWVRETANAVFLKKRRVLLVVCEDITEQKRAKEAARRSEKELRDAIETIPALVFITLPDGSNASANRRWREYTGLSAEETAGSGWQSVIHPADVEIHLDKWRASVANGQPLEDVTRFRRGADGEYRWFLVRSVPLRDEGRKIVRWYGTLTDIEDRKRAEEALRRSEYYLAQAQRLSHTGSFGWAPFTREMNYCSEEMLRIYGYDLQERIPSGETFVQRTHPEDREALLERIAKAAREKASYTHEFRVLLPDGTVKYIQAIGNPVLDRKGEILEFVGTAMDVTEHKRVEEALRRSEAYLAEAQRLTHTGSWAFKARTNTAAYWSEENFRIWEFDPQQGAPDAEMVGQRIHPEDRDWVRQHREEAVREREDYAHEFRIVMPDGKIKHIHVLGHPVFTASGDHVEVVGTHVDVTEQKRVEQERDRMRQLEAELAHINRVTTMGELTASLAHEVNQPIAAAMTNANTCVRWLAGDHPNIEEAREAARRIVKDATRAAEIISRTRLLFKKSAQELEAVDLNEVINDIIVLLRNEAAEHSVSVRTELAEECPRVIGDRVQLQQVLMNLMINSIEAMKRVEGSRELTLRLQRDKADQLLVSVIDTGAGLPPESDKIFDAFFTTKSQGTGMGLAISRTIIESHAGRLWATSNSGRGTIFYFTLPTETEARP